MRYTTNHIQQLKEGAISRIADTAYALRFLKLLVTPWEKMKAFELGVIDKDGRRTTFKTPAGREYKTELKTMEQKSSYTIFHRLVFNIKRLLNKVPFGKTRLASYAAALFLIKEHTGMSEKKIKQIMDKVELELDWDNLPLEESTWFQSIDGKLNPGSYTLVNDIASPKTGEVIAKQNSRIKVEEQIEPYSEFLGTSIYQVTHQKTNETIFITNQDIVR